MKLPFEPNPDRLFPWAAVRPVNVFAEPQPEGSEWPFILHGVAGLTAAATVGTGPIQGMCVMGSLVYVVSGGKLYSVNSGGASTLLGTMSLSAGPVTMENNGVQVSIVENNTQYTYNVSTGVFAQVTDAAFLGASNVSYIDGYGVYGGVGAYSRQWFASNLNDFRGYNALNFYTLNSSSSNVIRTFVDHRQVWIFGGLSTEVWVNSGTFPTPFKIMAGAVIERGCGAALSVAKIDNSIVWLGNDRIVYRANGIGAPARISSFPMDDQVRQYLDVSDALSFAWTERGHWFYAITFPQANSGLGATWVYDASSGMWHERSSAANGVGRWRANCIAFAFGQNWVGDCVSGVIYRIDPDVQSEGGSTLARIASFKPLEAEATFATASKLQLLAAVGTGDGTFVERTVDLTTEDGTSYLLTETGLRLWAQGQYVPNEPKAMLQWSNDGGRTWSNEHWASLGAGGDYLARPIWRRLGQFRRRIYRLTITDPVAVKLYGADTDIKAGAP